MISPYYLEHFLRTSQAQQEIRRSSRKSSQANIFLGPIKALQILIPPLALQKEFARARIAFDRLKENQLSSETEINQLFNSLAHRAFRGELKLAS